MKSGWKLTPILESRKEKQIAVAGKLSVAWARPF